MGCVRKRDKEKSDCVTPTWWRRAWQVGVYVYV